MTDKEILILIWEVFCGRELTKEPGRICTLSKYHRFKKSYNVPYIIAKALINYEVVIEDSGNLETGEVHYVVNEKDLFIKNMAKLLSDRKNIQPFAWSFDDIVQIKRDIKTEKILNGK